MKPTNYKEDDHFLKDSSIPISEKIDYLESFIIQYKSDKVELQQQLDNTEYYGPGTPTEIDVQSIYGDMETAEAYKNLLWDGKIHGLKRSIQNKKNSIKKLSVKLEYYQKLQQDEVFNNQKEKAGRPTEFDDKPTNPDDIYKRILSTKHGQRAGKIALAEFIKEQSGHSTWPKAFKEADKIHRRVIGKHIYKTFSGFETTKSNFLKESSHNRKILNEILKTLK